MSDEAKTPPSSARRAVTAPPTNPEALREALLETVHAGLSHIPFWERETSAETVDALISGPLASVLAERDAALAERDEAQNLAYQLKLAAAGGEDVPGSGQAVTFEDVNRWRTEASQREDTATARAERTAGELAAAKARIAVLEGVLSDAANEMEGVTVFVTSRERIKHPEGTGFWRDAIAKVRTAITTGEPS